jgi:hypothetical protein
MIARKAMARISGKEGRKRGEIEVERITITRVKPY